MESSQKRIESELELLRKRLSLKDLSEALYFPKYFEIDPIRACNAKCEMCPVWKFPGRKMEDALFSKIAEEMSHYSDWINTVCLSRDGEPLLDKNLEEKIRKLKQFGIKKVTFSTNASLLDEKRAVSLIDSGLDDIMFSVDGATKKTFEAIKNGLNFEQVVENCLAFIRIRGERKKPSVRIRMVLQEKNRGEEEEWKKYWLSKVSENDVVYSKAMHSWGNQLPECEGQNREVEKYAHIPCVSLWSTMIIHFDGTVPLCGSDFKNKVLMGDLNNSSIKEIWNSEKFKRARELHASGRRNDISLCPGCNIWDLNEKKVY